MDKAELGSDVWLANLKALIEARVRSSDGGLHFSICETFFNVPDHLDRQGEGTISWHCIVDGYDVQFGRTVLEDADIRSSADYAFVLPIARRIYSDEIMAEVEAYKAEGAKIGKYSSVAKNPTVVPPYFREVHNALASLTL